MDNLSKRHGRDFSATFYDYFALNLGSTDCTELIILHLSWEIRSLLGSNWWHYLKTRRVYGSSRVWIAGSVLCNGFNCKTKLSIRLR